jgi:hypothetical protein
MADTDPLARFSEARDRFLRTALFLSGLSILGAGASRLPTWEVQAPVEWLAGSVNVGFLPIFGPMLIVFGYGYLYLVWQAMVRTASAIPPDLRSADGPLGFELARFDGRNKRRTAAALFVFRLWCFVVPIVAYVILLTTYADFCAPGASPDDQAALCTGTQRVLTLVVGTQGVTGFQPRLASIQDNLRDRAMGTGDADERSRLLRLSSHVPWIYPPLQTWLYLGGLVFLIYLGGGAMSGNRREP